MDIKALCFFFSFFFFFFFFFSIVLTCSLSTFSISHTNNNQILLCALTHPTTTAQPRLNCTTTLPNATFNFPAASSPSAVVGGNGFFCALTSSSSVLLCWRFSTTANVTATAPTRVYIGAALQDLDSGNSHICGLSGPNNALLCWQWRRFNPGSRTLMNSSLSVGSNFVCGLNASGGILCLGSYSRVTDHVPAGNYSVVSAGSTHACAISSSDASLVCWGEGTGQVPRGEFASLALGERRSCALSRINETVVCWGEAGFALPAALRGMSFLALDASREVFCGVRTDDYSLFCWGNSNLDENRAVFQDVLPGPCARQCPCETLPGSSAYCGEGLMVCRPCPPRVEQSPPPLWPPQTPSPPRTNNSTWNARNVAFLVVGCVGSLSLLKVCCVVLFNKYCNVRGSRIHDSGPMDEPGLQLQGPWVQEPPRVLEKRLSHLISIGNGGGKLEEFSLQALLNATDNFSDANKIGTGSFGSVYRGKLEPDGQEVAIKRAEASGSSSGGTKRGHQEEDKDDAFLAELEFLSRLNHKNLVRLLGYCEESNERVLVYEYMSNGTLHDHLHKLENSPLMSWSSRIKVALNAARGIEYLHVYAIPPIIHRDIKSSNILLDDTWTAKVSDFGLSLMGPQDDVSHLSMRAAGTVGYMDPEYYRLQQLTTKSDVYSFGVLLLEMLSGCKAIHRREGGEPRNVVDYVAPYIVNDEIHRVLDRRVPPPTPFEIEAVAYVGYLAVDCVTLEGRDRPGMSEIVNSLERALAACLATPMLSRSSTDSST